MLSQKVFRDRICEQRLSAEFENYGITADDIDFITELIHYETKNVGKKFKYEDKGFLYQVCIIRSRSRLVPSIIIIIIFNDYHDQI